MRLITYRKLLQVNAAKIGSESLNEGALGFSQTASTLWLRFCEKNQDIVEYIVCCCAPEVMFAYFLNNFKHVCSVLFMSLYLCIYQRL